VHAQEVDDLWIVQTASDDPERRQRLFPRIAKGGASSFAPVQATMITQRRPMIVKMLLEAKNAAAAEVHVVDASWFVLRADVDAIALQRVGRRRALAKYVSRGSRNSRWARP